MFLRVRFISTFLVVAATLHALSSLVSAKDVAQLCQPTVSDPVVVATAPQRLAAGNITEPPLTGMADGFVWPDTPIGVLKNDSGYEFFASDGGLHSRQLWQGHWVGNNLLVP